MIKVKAKRTFFTVFVDGENIKLIYDSEVIPSNSDLLVQAKNVTGGYDVNLISRETVNILLTMDFETFYGFCHIEICDKLNSFWKN